MCVCVCVPCCLKCPLPRTIVEHHFCTRLMKAGVLIVSCVCARVCVCVYAQDNLIRDYRLASRNRKKPSSPDARDPAALAVALAENTPTAASHVKVRVCVCVCVYVNIYTCSHPCLRAYVHVPCSIPVCVCVCVCVCVSFHRCSWLAASPCFPPVMRVPPHAHTFSSVSPVTRTLTLPAWRTVCHLPMMTSRCGCWRAHRSWNTTSSEWD